MIANPVIAEVLRGGVVESQHRGSYVIVNSENKIVAQAGNSAAPFFPRSAIKVFQCLPMVESGAAQAFSLDAQEIALCCSSHGGEPEHVRVARSILAKAGVNETCYECGAHMPTAREACYDLVRGGEKPQAVHNNCSGKHAGMLAFAKHMGFDFENYVLPGHPVQQAVAKCISAYCEVDVSVAPMGVDGCSVPTWALPMQNVAHGFAKLTDLANNAARLIIEAAAAHPFMIAGTGRFDTNIMQEVPRLFIKVGAEGVFCGCIPHAGLGFALKCDDGAMRGAEVAIAKVLSKLDVWTKSEREKIQNFAYEDMSNWRKIAVGTVQAK